MGNSWPQSSGLSWGQKVSFALIQQTLHGWYLYTYPVLQESLSLLQFSFLYLKAKATGDDGSDQEGSGDAHRLSF